MSTDLNEVWRSQRDRRAREQDELNEAWKRSRGQGQTSRAAPASEPLPAFRERARMGMLEAGGIAALDSASLGFGDEIEGGLAAAGAALTGRDAGTAYRERVAEARARLQQARDDQAGAAFVGSMVGAMVPGGALFKATKALPGMAGLARASAGRGGRALAAQMGVGAATGAIGGGIYGAGSGEDFQDRANKALEGAGFGAVGGAAFVPIGQAVGAGVKAGGRALANSSAGQAVGRVTQRALDATRYSPNQMNSIVGGLPPSSGARPPAAPSGGAPAGPSDDVVAGVDRILGRQNLTPDQLEASVARGRSDPFNRRLADHLGDAGSAKLKQIAQSPGQTGAAAREVAHDRAYDLPTRLINDLRSRMGVTRSPTQARQQLEQEFRATSAKGYEPVLRQELPPGELDTLIPELQRFPPRIRERAFEIVDDLIHIDGLDKSSMTGAQQVHYLKMALDDAITSLDNAEGLKVGTRNALRRLKGDFLRRVEGDEAQGMAPLIPGYREARMQWGSLKEAEEALEEGARILQMRPEEAAATMAKLSPMQREYYRVAVADEISRKLMSRASEVGDWNAANALNSRELQGVLATVFDDPNQAAAFLARVNEGNVLMRNAAAWKSGSDTLQKALLAGEDGNVAQTVLTALTNRLQAGAKAVDAIRGPAIEAQRDRLGAALLRETDMPEEDAWMAALIKALRKREAERAGRAQEAGISGATGAIGLPDE